MAAALKSGRPQLIIPFAVDQPFWAHRLARLGYALEPLTEKQLTKERLVQRLNEFNNPKVKQQAQAIRQIIAKEQGVDDAITLIEKIVRESQLVNQKG